MTQLQKVKIDGLLQTVNYNFAALGPIGADDGVGNLRVARFTFDTEAVDSDGVDNIDVGAHGTGVTIPAYAIIVGGFFDVNTPFGSAADSATVAIRVEGANDIQTATAVSGAPYSTIGRKAIVPKANTPESTSVKTTVAREITCTVAVQALEVGKLTGYIYFVDGILSEATSE
jgi:hypothetical protein